MVPKQIIYYPTFQKRIAANAIDYVLLGLILIVSTFEVESAYRGLVVGGFFYLYFFLVPSIINGQSLGKWFAKIQVVQLKDYSNASILTLQLRELLKFSFILIALGLQFFSTIPILNGLGMFFTFLTFVYLIIEIFMVIENKDKRGLHDRLAKTIVIDLNYKETHVVRDTFEDHFNL